MNPDLEKIIREEKKEIRNRDILEVMSTVVGRRLIYEIVFESTGFEEVLPAVEHEALLLENARRSWAKKWIDILSATCSGYYTQMLQEALITKQTRQSLREMRKP